MGEDVYVGIDVSKRELVVAVWTYPDSVDGVGLR
jgi:hypothetical protein